MNRVEESLLQAGRFVIFLLLLTAGAAWAWQAPDAGEWKILGTVRFNAHPVKGAFVTASGPAYVKPASTDALGHFILSGNTAGRYLIQVRKNDLPDAATYTVTLAAGTHIDPMDFDILKGGVISGRVLDNQKQPVEGIHIEAMEKEPGRNRVVLSSKSEALTNDRGEYRLPNLASGSYVITAGPRPQEFRKRSRRSVKALQQAYPALTFYPGGQLLNDASPVEVHAGQERPGIDFAFDKVPAYCVSFEVEQNEVSFDEGSHLVALFRPWLGSLGSMPPGFGGGNPSFGVDAEICGITKGEYKLELSTPRVEHGLLHISGYASAVITVDKEDVELGSIALTPSSVVQGLVSGKDARPRDLIPPGVLVGLSLNGVRFFMGSPLEADVQPTGVFTITGVWQDQYELQVLRMPKGYYLIAASQQGRNVAEGGLQPGGGEIQVVLGSDGPTLRGRAVTEQGDGVANASVFLIPKTGEPAMAAQTDQTGGYEFTSGMAPGDYQVAALTGLYESERADPGIAAHLHFNRGDLTLRPGQSLNLNVKVQAAR